MRATYGFRASLTAHPGKGDELVDEVPVGGLLRNGGAS